MGGNMKKYFTSESVTEGHPDKLCDQISDAVLDAMLEKDPASRVACETVASTGLIFVTGQATTNCYADIEKIARDVVRDAGYDRAKYGFDCDTCSVVTSLNAQSPDIALGVNSSLERRKKGALSASDKFGAGDQGMMFGFACDETAELMPAPIYFAHNLAKRLARVRKEKIVNYLRPDGKTQVTVEYENDRPVRIENIVVSTQHAPEAEPEQIESDMKKHVIEALDEIKNLIDDKTKYFINPTGRFVFGGPAADSGLTGRKIIVDTYGGYASHGGGCFSGKDPTKVDRTGAYMARYIAKNLVAQGLCRKCEIQISYAIGVAQPLSIWAATSGAGKVSDEKLAAIIKEKYDCRPAAIIEKFDMARPIYRQTAAYGHFGRSDLDLPWEKIEN